MALVDLWASSRDQLKQKHVQQIIAFAGDGKLLDGREASDEFRDFLTEIPSDFLAKYAEECLGDSFRDSGYALQDIVNQVGRRLGLRVIDGRYRGTSAHVGFDGLWHFPGGHTVIVEVKTTDVYRIKLDKIVSYQHALIDNGTLAKGGSSSILIVVGRQDTGDLEAQIRGSRHAWDVRLISVDALLRLMVLKEAVEDPIIVRRIHDILIPREFTRLDEIVDILFSTAQDIKQDEELPQEIQEAEEEDLDEPKPKFTPVAFHEACVERIGNRLSKNLLKRSRATFSSADESLGLICSVSKEHSRGGRISYWFAFHPHQKEFLESMEEAYVAFGCGSKEQVLLIPFDTFSSWLDGMNITQKDDRFYWHVSILRQDESFVLRRKRGQPKIDLTPYLLPDDAGDDT
jgi:hypothetical protein